MKDPPRKEEQVSLYCDEELKENIRYHNYYLKHFD